MLDPKQTFLAGSRAFMLAFAGLFLLCPAAVTQAAPLRIDIQSVTIEAKSNWLQPTVSIVALDEAGNQVTYGGAGSFVVSLVGLGPVPLPRTVSTNFLHGNQVGYGSVTRWAYFTLTEGHSDPITLYPTTPRKPETFIRTGAAGCRGKFEYYVEFQGLVAYDDDVVLEGSYQAFLSNRNYMDGRKIELTRMLYVLTKPEN